MFESNQIEKLECNICFDDKSLSDLTATALTEFYKNQVPETIDEIIEALHIDDQLTIENINLDLGAFEYTDYQDRSKRKLKNLLEEEILKKYRKAIDNSGGGQRIILKKHILLERIKYYLTHGCFNWEYTGTNNTNPEKLILEIIGNYAEEFELFLRASGKDENIKKRVVNLLTPKNYYALVEKLDPENAEYYISYSKDVQKIQHRTGSLPCTDKDFRKLTWLLILSHILIERGSYFNQKQFIKWMIEKYTVNYNLEFYKFLEVLKNQCLQIVDDISCGTNLITIINEIYFESTKKAEDKFTEKKTEKFSPKMFLDEYYTSTNQEVKNNLLKRMGLEYITENYSRPLLKILIQKEFVKKIIRILEPVNAKYICEFSDMLSSSWKKEKFVKTYELEFEETKWETIFKILFTGRGSVFNKKEFVKNTLKKMADHYNAEYFEIVKTICAVLNKIQSNKSGGELFLILAGIENDYEIEIQKKEASYKIGSDCLRTYEIIVNRLKGKSVGERKSITVLLEFLSKHNPLLLSKLKNRIATDFEIQKKLKFALSSHEMKNVLRIFLENIYQIGNREFLEITKNSIAVSPDSEKEFYCTLFLNLLKSKNINEVKEIVSTATSKKETIRNNLCEFVKSIIDRMNYSGPDLSVIKTIFSNAAISDETKIISVMERLIELPEGIEKFTSQLDRQSFFSVIKKLLPLYNKEAEWKAVIELLGQVLQQRSILLSEKNKVQILLLTINSSGQKSFEIFFDLIISNLGMEERELFIIGLNSEAANIQNSIISKYLSSENLSSDDSPRFKQASSEWRKYESKELFNRLQEIFYESPISPRKNAAGAMLACLLEKEADKTKEFFKNIMINKKLVEGSIRELGEEDLYAILKLMNPYSFDVIYSYSEIVWQAVQLQPALTGIKNYKQAKWELIFEYLAVLRNNVFNSNKFLKWLIENLGRKQSVKSKEEFTVNIYERILLLDIEGIIKDNQKIVEDIKMIGGIEKPAKGGNQNKMTKNKYPEREEKGFEDSVYVNNAGLILTAPFLPRLFDMLSYTAKNVFVSAEKQHRAANLLQHLVFHDPEYYEHEILLNKILCDIPVEEVVDTKCLFSEDEINVVQDLLNGMISNWNGLGSVSIDGFRETFLAREGKLELKDNGWHLHVKQHAFDVLMDRLPWSITIIKLPWMSKAIYTDWR